ncbi:MAG: hemolysin [Alteromonadaceae bacterium]|nr:MAG: hemolysin [Alteromonadaceae bacterium]
MTTTDTTYNPFRIPIKNRFLASVMGRILGLTPLAKYYDVRPTRMDEGEEESSLETTQEFLRYTLDVLEAAIEVENPEALDQIPETGPVIFVSNHPLGGLEGVAMTEVLLKKRPDTLVLTNQLLTKIPELRRAFVGVDILSKGGSKKNGQSLRRIFQHLSKGGALLIYPAGKVSAINTKNWKIEDDTWNSLVGKLVQRYKAPCVPFYVHARNSRLFYLAGLIHPMLRTAMLGRELSNKQGKRFTLSVGQVIGMEELRGLADVDAVTQYFRMATDLLGKQKVTKLSKIVERDTVPVASINKGLAASAELEKDFRSINEYFLLEHKEFSVYCAPTDKLGSIMLHIAAARELTFRAVGEGTGKGYDTDHFDPYYMQLFVWDNDKKCVVGGYRVGHAGQIVKDHGVKGLYSRSLYKFDESYMDALGESAIEIGRSFIVPEYQRLPRSLDLLWRGIGIYIARYDCHTLFGCVSISQEHSALARAFISDSMMESFCAEQKYLHNVEPVAPLKVKGKVWTPEILAKLNTIVAINKLVGHCDPGKSIPILLRQYIALNGRFVGFSVNKDFNESLDGLVLVDLRTTPARYLQRYFGKDHYQVFAKRWQLEGAA